MDATLGYLREILSNYEDNDHCLQLYNKITEKNYENEEEFVRDLEETDISILNDILPEEIEYAREELDNKRAEQLTEVYELLI